MNSNGVVWIVVAVLAIIFLYVWSTKKTNENNIVTSPGTPATGTRNTYGSDVIMTTSTVVPSSAENVCVLTDANGNEVTITSKTNSDLFRKACQNQQPVYYLNTYWYPTRWFWGGRWSGGHRGTGGTGGTGGSPGVGAGSGGTGGTGG